MPANHYYNRPAPVLPPVDSLPYPANVIAGCSECGLRSGCTRPVPGENTDGHHEVMLVGQNPGFNEDREGKPFIGQAGQYLDSLLFQSGVSRESVAVCNLVKCLTPNNRPLRLDEIQACSHWLDIELELVQPKIVVAMGAPAIARFLGSSAGTVEHLHGKPVEVDGRIILPAYHPAAALRDTAKLRQCQEDFQVLRGLVKGRDWREYHVVDEYPNPVYRVADTDELLGEMADEITESGEFAVDTETCRGKLWSVQISAKPGTAWFIPVHENHTGRVDLSKFGATAIVHNYLFDIQYLKLDETNFVDTMTQAYLLGQPQGLKELANRLCGISMITYGEMVKSGQQELSLAYLLKASGMEWSDPPTLEETKWDNKKGCLITKNKKPWHISRKINKMLDDYGRDNDTDLWDRWRNIPEEERVVVESVLGSMPESSLADIPFADAVQYACLSGDSKVLMADGMYRGIRDLVNNCSHGEVMSLHPKYGIVPRSIIGWHKITCHERVAWWSVETEESRFNGRWRNIGTRYTGDHRLYVASGLTRSAVSGEWKKVEDLIPDKDLVALPFMELSWIQRQITLGSVLGDGCLGRRNKNGWSNLRLSHSEKQEAYLRWKVHLLGDLVIQQAKPVVERMTKRPNQEIKTLYKRVDSETVYHPSLEQLYKQVYISGSKSIGDWVNNLDSLGLAIFYLDDGTLVNNVSPRLYACDFDAESVDKLISFLYKKWGIRASKTLMSGRVDQYQVHILAPYDKFWSVVSRWVIPSMQYKLPQQWHGQFTGELTGHQCYSYGPVYSKVTKVSQNPHAAGRRGSLRTKWCIDVEETHNFLTMGEIAHNCRDSDATLRVYHKLKKMITDSELDFIQYLDLSVLPQVYEMMQNGMPVDIPYLKGLSGYYFQNMEVAASLASAKVGHPFNPNSSKQVAEVVYGELGFKPTKKTATGLISTDDQELKKIKHPVIVDILEYRRNLKNKSTFADALVENAVPCQQGKDTVYRVHTTLKTTRTETGRLSSADPVNLQTMPIRSEDGKKIRKGFRASPGYKLLAGDFSQQEMRLQAHEAHCENLLTAYRNGVDVHTLTASRIFGVPMDIAEQAKYRYPAKTLNFSVIYIVSAIGLYENIHEQALDIIVDGKPLDVSEWTEDSCQKLIDDWYKLNWEVKDWQMEKIAEARRFGYVKDIFGRRRYVPEVSCPIQRIQESGERMCVNFPTQGGCASITKLAMLESYQSRNRLYFTDDVRFLMAIHDELMLEVREDMVMEIAVWLKGVMDNVVALDIPMVSEIKAGDNWVEMSKIELGVC